MLRLAFQTFVALTCGAVAVVLHEIWGEAARNSASPGAIVLLGLAALFAFVALLTGLAVAIEILLRLKGRRAESG